MSAIYQISRDNTCRPLAWRYRQNMLSAWSYFPDKPAESIKGMKDYLTVNGRMEASMHFTDSDGQPATIAEVRRINNKIDVRINAGENCHILNETDFVSLQDQIIFFRDRADTDVNEEVAKSNMTPFKAVEFYKERAVEITLDEFGYLLRDKMTDAGITELLKAREGEGVKVHFIED